MIYFVTLIVYSCLLFFIYFLNMINLKYKILFVVLSLSMLSITQALSYPLKEVNIGNCKNKDNCWIDLPVIKNANYTLYQENNLYRTIYSVLWGAWYKNWWDLWLWTHLWVDIATIKGTPVYSILDWEVILSKEDWAWGNTIIVKHIWNDEIIFSTYAHLETSFVNAWDIVKEWDMVALVWDSGNTTWPHLHRQIEKSSVKIHPFYPYGCGNTIEDSVNSASCWDQLYKYTLDPIRFIETEWHNLRIEKDPNISTYMKLNELEITIASWNIWLQNSNNILNFKNKSKKTGVSILEKPIEIIYDKKKIELETDYFYTINDTRNIKAKGIKEWLTQIKIIYWDFTIKKLYYLVISKEKLNILNKYYNLSNILKKINF